MCLPPPTFTEVLIRQIVDGNILRQGDHVLFARNMTRHVQYLALFFGGHVGKGRHGGSVLAEGHGKPLRNVAV